jgi:WD40 repeat protein
MATNATFNRVFKGVVNAVQFDAAVTAKDLKSWGLNEGQTNKVLALIQGAKLDECAGAPMKVADLQNRLIVALDMTSLHSLTAQPSEDCLWPELSWDATVKALPYMSPQTVSVCGTLVCKGWNQFFSCADIVQLLAFSHFPCIQIESFEDYRKVAANSKDWGHSLRTVQMYPSYKGIDTLFAHGDLLISSTPWDNAEIKICNWNEMTSLATFQGYDLRDKNPFALGPEQKLFLLGPGRETVEVVNWKTQASIATLRPLESWHSYGPMALARNKLCLSLDVGNKGIQVWDANTCEQITELKEAGHDRSMALFAYENKLIASCSSNHHIWDLDSYRCIATLKGDIGDKCLHAQGRNLFFAGAQAGSIKVLDADTWKWKEELKVHKYAVRALAGQGNVFFSSCNGGEIRRWKLPSMTCTNVYKVSAVALFFANKQLFLGNNNGEIQVWDFDVSLRQFLEEIADAFESSLTLTDVRPDDAEKRIIARFKKLPQEAQERIFKKLNEILDPQGTEDLWESDVENAFCNPWEPNHIPRRGLRLIATPSQKAEAIRRCL